eukprot:73440_1
MRQTGGVEQIGGMRQIGGMNQTDDMSQMGGMVPIGGMRIHQHPNQVNVEVPMGGQFGVSVMPDGRQPMTEVKLVRKSHPRRNILNRPWTQTASTIHRKEYYVPGGNCYAGSRYSFQTRTRTLPRKLRMIRQVTVAAILRRNS